MTPTYPGHHNLSALSSWCDNQMNEYTQEIRKKKIAIIKESRGIFKDFAKIWLTSN